MNFYVLTLFPEMITGGLSHSVIKRAADKDIINISCVDIRDFAGNKHNQVDDYPYGGGSGMLLKPNCVYDCYMSVKDKVRSGTRVVYMTPQGRPFSQKTAEELSKETDLIILCGHYEGVDERVIEEIVTDEISMGDYILTGGELPAMTLIDCVSRLLPGVLNREESHLDESFAGGLLEYPQYTRPECFLGKRVPDVLLSGHHENIYKWRREQSVLRTKERRPELIGGDFMKGIITVVGKDSVGIIAKVCTFLAEANINILDISQTIVGGYFNMMMIVNLSGMHKPFDLMAEDLQQLGGSIGVDIKLQREDIFNSMHRI